jgi:intracellular septation protein
MKFLFDFFPVLAFFIAYYLPDDRSQAIYAATATAIIASVIQIGIYWYRNKKVEKMHLITLAIILVLGGATLLLHDEKFIKWKPTAVYWVFALILTGGQFLLKKNLIKSMLGQQLKLPEQLWGPLNLSWAGFFAAVGCINLYVAFNFSTEFWVNFKLFGILGLLLLFAVCQSVYLARHISDTEESGEP